MRNIFALLSAGFILLAITGAQMGQATSRPGKIQFVAGSLDDALKQAEKSNKLIFIDFYADWCRPCKLMDKDVFGHYQVADYFNEKFISIKIDADQPAGKSLCSEYSVMALPTLVFMDPKGNTILRNAGYLNADELLEMARKAIRQRK